ncbi:MAG: hypothetical protein ACTHOU_01240 [Aureliella sp.]
MRRFQNFFSAPRRTSRSLQPQLLSKLLSLSLLPSPVPLLPLFVLPLLLLLLLPTSSRALGQPPDPNDSRGSDQQPGSASHAILPAEVAELEIAFGRMRLAPRHFRIVRSHETFDNQSSWRSLQVSVEEGRPALRMRLADACESWSLEANSRFGVHWSRELFRDGRTLKVDYSQPPRGPIVINVSGLSGRPSELRGPTLWHLTEQNAPEFEQAVVPALSRLNGQWNLHETLQRAKQVRRAAGISSGVEPEMLAQWVADLESDQRSVRAAAAEQLRLAGVQAQLPLSQLAHSSLSQGPLSIQQRKTIENLLAILEPESADTPTRLAYWLSGDPRWR